MGGEWGACNATCGPGFQSRVKIQEANLCGKNCTRKNIRICTIQKCPIDCELGSWSYCHATCGTGIQSRIIVQEALYGGKECSTIRTIKCNTEPCPIVQPNQPVCRWGL